jgi:gliding motility-associated-like protein
VGGLTIDPLTYVFPVGVTTVTWIAEDDAGNTASCTQQVTVVDDEIPELTCPNDTTVIQDGGGSCNAAVTNLAPDADDNCGIVLQTWTMTGATTNSSPGTGIHDVSGEVFEIGVTTVEYTVEDAAGNSATCSFTVEIYDEVDGGSIQADQDICYNTLPAELTNVVSASVCGGYTYQWEKKTGTGGWADIPGATGENYQEINPLTETTYYTRQAISDLGFGTANSDTVTITITPAPTVFAGEDTTLCYGTPYQILDADTTYSGGINWEILTGNGTLDDINILDPTYTPVLLDGGTTVELVLHASGLSNCNDVTDTVRITYLPKLLVSIGKPSPFLIDSTSTEINVSFNISNHEYVSLIGLYLVSPLDSVVELKPICSDIGMITPTVDLEAEFYNDPDNSSGLIPIPTCDPGDGVYLFSGDWKKKLHGQDPANGSWRLMIKDSLNFGSPGIFEQGEIRFGDINYEGNFEEVVYADTMINKPIKGHTGAGPAAITMQALSLTGLTTSCYGVCDATAVGTASGGQPPYVLYEWSDTSDFSNIIATTDTVDLCAGTFYLRVTDSHGCSAIDSITVGEPPEIMIDSDTVVHNTCHGYADGKIALAFSGGTGTLEYTLNGTDWYNSGDTIEGLGAGDYLVTIEDATGCIKDTTITILQPDPITIETNYSGITCSGYTDGEIEIIATNGTSPYEYSIDSGLTWHTTNTFGGLTTDTFYIAVQDFNGCIQYGDTVIIQEAEPMSISVVELLDEYRCINSSKRDENQTGLITVEVTGGKGDYDYQWQSGATTLTGNETIRNLSAGIYDLTVEDSLGCEKDTTFTIGSDLSYDLEFTVDIEDTTICWYQPIHFTFNTVNADSLEIQKYRPVSSYSYIELTGETMEYNYTISENNYFNLKAFNAYCEEDYITEEFRYYPDRELSIVENDDQENDTIIIKGDDGRWDALAYVNNPAGLVVNWIPTAGVASPDSLNTVISPAESMWYAVNITTVQGECADTDSVYLTYVPDIVAYDGFSPNGDGINDYWYIENIDAFKNNVVTVYNRWGTKVFEQKGYMNNDSNKRWDGTAKNGKQVGSGTYYYIIILNEEGFSSVTGAVTIMR